MLRCNHQVRLTKDEIAKLTLLTGKVPAGIRTIAELNAFIDEHASLYSEDTHEGRLLKLMLLDLKPEPVDTAPVTLNP